MRWIRKIQESDTRNFLALCKQLDEENKLMLLELGERKTTVEEQRQQIKDILSKDNQTIFVMGFVIEGTKRDSLLVDGSYVDEYYMAKLINMRG